MPQLNPHPWFSIFITSWLILIIILLPKIKSHIPNNSPTNKKNMLTTPMPWTWPWT
uniref:ATP synthase F(0) complex subunit 8 n=1 Tax=Pelomedusa subrufa TaxID=44522 RepID=ATP8_PELSU|nr:ATP synthase F0 subunit 8 [Pelomedusa subrufa]O79674.1 RecName: Full=ATP synthase protein 8; AltName: Full=A6L; AltName: Full=F-ATPase subunit 8 [Pelomedusa subrufa]AAD05054.1 ATPase subunit 8 [Pelomedusa subrufa]